MPFTYKPNESYIKKKITSSFLIFKNTCKYISSFSNNLKDELNHKWRKHFFRNLSFPVKTQHCRVLYTDLVLKGLS